MPNDPMGSEREVWKSIPGYEGIYEVSDLGRVRSLDRIVEHLGGERRVEGRIRKLTANSDGYLGVNLCKDGSTRRKRVHRIVLEAFVGPPEDGQECCHNNGDPADNRLENLRWGTAVENAKDKRKHGSMYQLNKTHCKACNRVRAREYWRRKNGTA